MNSTEMDEITVLMNAWKVAADKVTSIKAEIATKQQEGAEAADIQSLQDTLTNAQTDENSTKTTLFDELAKRSSHSSPDQSTATVVSPSTQQAPATDRETVSSGRIFGDQETRISARMTAPKEYKHGEDFTTWCSRFRRYLRTSRIHRNDAFDLLLNNVDDRTLDKLEPVAERLGTDERRDPDLFIPIFEQIIYPKSDIRALRQKLTSGNTVQEDDEDIDAFAARIRSLAKRAYSNPSERHEPCLNAFLNGMKDEMLFDKVVSVPGAEDNFDLAVESATKFEKLRRTTRSKTSELDVLRISNSSTDQTTGDDFREDRNRSVDRTPDRREQGPRDNFRHHNYRQNNRRFQGNSRGRGSGASRGGQRQGGNRQCFLCHERGHIVSECPINPLNGNRAGRSQNVGPEQ